jgi:hypothetical protein
MTKIAEVARFDRPEEEVFDFLADPRNEPRCNPLILQEWKTTPGATGPGPDVGSGRGRSGGRDHRHKA